MFSWRRKPVTVTKERSIPVPLKVGADSAELKNSSRPQSSPAGVAPEFSRVAAKGSVESLRRLVGAQLDAGAKESAAEDSSLNKGASETAPKAAEASGWIWSLFRTTEARQREGNVAPTDNHSPPPSARASSSAPPEKNTGKAAKASAPAPSPRATPPEASPAPATPPPKRRKPHHPSLVLPGFSTVPWPSKRERLANLVWTSAPAALTRKPPARVRRAVVIGVHGYFPARVTRRLLGEPTGTSVKFATEAEQRLRHWLESRGQNADSVHIDKIALEGEGKIGLRISVLYDLVLQWRDALAKADLVFFAAHSQGAVVTASLIAKLLDARVLDPRRQNISMLAMAGSWLGPMPGMDETLVMKAITRIEHDSLLELFELQRSTTAVSTELHNSLTRILERGVKLTLVGSADDQLIPLYSALALDLRHPNVFRAVYIDGKDVIPHVVAPLLQLALRQLNAGRQDHGVIVELSATLAGALTSKGHSKLYSHDAVYDLAFQVALETQAGSTAASAGTRVEDFEIPRAAVANPYRLPWAVQALVSDSRTKELNPVVAELVHQFRAWQPETKAMKDLKWRLAGLNSSKL